MSAPTIRQTWEARVYRVNAWREMKDRPPLEFADPLAEDEPEPSRTCRPPRPPESWTSAEMGALTDWARGGGDGTWVGWGKLSVDIPRPISRATVIKPWTPADYRAEAKRLGYEYVQ